MKYQPTRTMRLVRTVHRVTVSDYDTAKEFIKALGNCPPNAKIVDRETDDYGDWVFTFEAEEEVGKD